MVSPAQPSALSFSVVPFDGTVHRVGLSLWGRWGRAQGRKGPPISLSLHMLWAQQPPSLPEEVLQGEEGTAGVVVETPMSRLPVLLHFPHPTPVCCCSWTSLTWGNPGVLHLCWHFAGSVLPGPHPQDSGRQVRFLTSEKACSLLKQPGSGCC